jgi:hypothetical protein
MEKDRLGVKGTPDMTATTCARRLLYRRTRAGARLLIRGGLALFCAACSSNSDSSAAGRGAVTLDAAADTPQDSAGGDGGAGGSGTGGGIADSGLSNWALCARGGAGGVDDQCVLEANNCCGQYCSSQPLSSYTAVNVERVAEWQASACSSEPTCSSCTTSIDANYTAVCRGHCVVIDIREDEFGACSSPSECRLRWGAKCCERCDGDAAALVAVSTKWAFDTIVCGTSSCSSTCDPPAYPSDAIADCVNGHCIVSAGHDQ